MTRNSGDFSARAATSASPSSSSFFARCPAGSVSTRVVQYAIALT